MLKHDEFVVQQSTSFVEAGQSKLDKRLERNLHLDPGGR